MGALKGRPVFCFVSHGGGEGVITELDKLCNWLKLKSVGPTISVNGNNISSKHISTIEKNIQEMLRLL